MSKKRVYELAREVGLESKIVIKKLEEIGIAVASHQSALDDKQVQKFFTSLKTPDELVAEAQKQPVVRRRKRQFADEPSEEIRDEAQVEEEKLPEEKPTLKAKVKKKVVLEEKIPVEELKVEFKREEKSEDLEDSKISFVEEDLPEVLQVSSEKMTSEVESHASSIVEKEKAEESFSSKRVTEEKKADTLLKTNSTAAPMKTREETSNLEKKWSQSRMGSVERKPEKKADIVITKTAGVPSKTFQGGATIVRRATKEESEALQMRESHRHKKKEDSPKTFIPQSKFPQQKKREQELPGKDNVRSFQQSSVSVDEPTYKDEQRDTYSGVRPEFKKVVDDSEDSSKVAKVFFKQKKPKFSFNPSMLEEEGVPQEPIRKMRVFSNYSKKRDFKSANTRHKKTQITVPRQEYRVIKMERDTITVSEMASQLNIKVAELIKKLMLQGVMATVNQEIDFDTVSLIAGEYKYECRSVKKTVEDILSEVETNPEDLETRPPIITVMGHVDHGKTSILDAIRQTGVADKEAGGITQHIGAYMVDHKGTKLTFLDTPGHEAFSAMRSRGAQLTDIVILVVAADDGVMPQTIEAIAHAKSAGVPIVVAVNKIDKSNVNFDRIYSELSEQGIQAESWGGDTQFVHVSALKKEGLEELLEALHLQAEVLDLKASKKGLATGRVIEAHLDKGRGTVATVIVTTGTLSVGDFVVVGSTIGRVRGLADYEGRKLKKAGPSTPVEIIGLSALPLAADPLNVVVDEKKAREVSDLRIANESAARTPASSAQTLDELLVQVQAESLPQISLLIKADTQGTVEAINDSISKLKSEKVNAKVIFKGVGGITESDLNLAETCQAVILSFNVRMPGALTGICERKGIVVQYFSVIYKLVDAVKGFMVGKLPPVTAEVIQGHAEVREAIRIPKVGFIAGSNVTDGKITRNSYLRLVRDDVVIYTGKLAALKRFKDDVKEVQSGYECGISFENCTDIKAGDIIEAYLIEESPAELDI